MRALKTRILYENPLPQLCSRQSAFPSLAALPDGRIAASFAIGQAFESVDSTTYLSFSGDGGVSWSDPVKMLSFDGEPCPVSDYCKITALPDGRLLALGYAYPRPDPSLPLGNVTGGVLDDFVFWSSSADGGKNWEAPHRIPCAGVHTEASAPITVLPDGGWITPIAPFPDWDGNWHGRVCGRALVSRDGGESWNADAVCTAFPGDATLSYEQRMCVLSSGTLVCISWNERIDTGERLCNHFTLSRDGGATWSEPVSTGVMGQASSVLSLGGERLLALHAVRRDTDRPGVYGCLVDLSHGTWNVLDRALLWEPETPVLRDPNAPEIFAYLKFGQPSAIRLKNGAVLMTHWFAENGQYKTALTEVEL